MITTAYTPILKHLKTYTVETASGVHVDGEYVETLTSSFCDLAAFPLTAKDLRMATDGAYTSQDKKYYEVGEQSLNHHDVIVDGSDRYRIMQITDRYNDGGFVIYMGKREAKS